MAKPSPLPLAQQRMFDKLGREFDNREYAKALRSADSILSTVPDDPDTVAMKGLTLHNMNRKEEGYELVKKAVALCPTSTIAWHSLGMCQRTDTNYTEALKAFKQALMTAPNNINVLRDISSTCVQLRDWEQFLDVREKMVTLRPSIRANWIALSCGRRMLGHTKLAAALMDLMTSIMDAGDTPVEVSEVQLYRVELELAGGSASKALELLKRHDGEIKDVVAKRQLRARAHAQLGQKAEAEKRYMELIEMGVFEADCIAALAQLRKISLDAQLRPRHDVDKFMELLRDVLAACPKSTYVQRHMLDCVPLEQFREHLASFAVVYIQKLIPSLFSVLKSLYQYPDRAAIIGEVFQGWEKELEAGNFASFGGVRDPCYILWIRTYLASHFRRLGDFATAHAYVDQAILHTPTLEMLYLEKAKILGREGKTAEAAEQADFARVLDLQDKYMNSKAAKYFFRDNQIKRGEDTMQIFYKRAATPEETFLTALESQCYWYECEVGEAFYRMGDYVSALQNFLMVNLHHHQNRCELNDFHNYVFRRSTMRTWFDILDCVDHLEKNKFFLKFCPGIVRTYMKVHELGEEAVRAAHVPRPPFPDDLSPEDSKRLGQLRGEYYMENIDLSEPLKKAEPYVNALLAHRSDKPETHVLAAKYYETIEKPLLVARELHALAKLGYNQTAELAADFEKTLYARVSDQLDARVKQLTDELLQLAKKNYEPSK